MLSKVFKSAKGKSYEAMKLTIPGYRESLSPRLDKHPRQEVVVFRVFDLYKSFPSYAILGSASIPRSLLVWTHEVPCHPSISDFPPLESRIALESLRRRPFQRH